MIMEPLTVRRSSSQASCRRLRSCPLRETLPSPCGEPLLSGSRDFPRGQGRGGVSLYLSRSSVAQQVGKPVPVIAVEQRAQLAAEGVDFAPVAGGGPQNRLVADEPIGLVRPSKKHHGLQRTVRRPHPPVTTRSPT